MVDGPDLHKRIAEATGKAAIRLAIDAIGGDATARLAHSVAPGGTVVNYGALSGQPCQVTQQDLIFRNVTPRGFWLAHWFNQATPADQMAVFGELIKLVATGKLQTHVEATYPLSRHQGRLGPRDEARPRRQDPVGARLGPSERMIAMANLRACW